MDMEDDDDDDGDGDDDDDDDDDDDADDDDDDDDDTDYLQNPIEQLTMYSHNQFIIVFTEFSGSIGSGLPKSLRFIVVPRSTTRKSRKNKLNLQTYR